MSLINQMLKDLETRRSASRYSSEALLQGLRSANLHSTKKLHALYLVFGLAVITMFFFFLVFQNTNRSQTTFPSIPPLTRFTQTTLLAHKINHPVFTLIPTTPVTLKKTVFDNQPTTTQVRFCLTRNAFYEVSSHLEGKNEKLVITLERTHLEQPIAPLDYADSAIHSIQTKTTLDGDLEISLLLNQGASIQRLADNLDHGVELQLDIAYPLTTEDQSNLDITSMPQAILHKIPTQITAQNEAEQNYQKGLWLAENSQSKTAISILRTALSQDPMHRAAREALATLLLEQRQVAQANQVLTVGIQQFPHYLPFLKLQARILINQGALQNALNLLQTTQPLMTEDPDYYGFIATLYQRLNQPALAVKLYEQLVAIQPEQAIWWLGLGIAMENLGKKNAAVDAYAKANSLGELSPSLRAFVENRVHTLL